MGRTFEKLGVAAALLAGVSTVCGQNGSSSAGPAWNHEDFATTPPVYPSREYSILMAFEHDTKNPRQRKPLE